MHFYLENLHFSPSPHHRRSILPHLIDNGLTMSFTLTKGPMESYGKWHCVNFKWNQYRRKALRGIKSFCQPCYSPVSAQKCFIIDGRCSFTLGLRMRSRLNLNTAWNRVTTAKLQIHTQEMNVSYKILEMKIIENYHSKNFYRI